MTKTQTKLIKTHAFLTDNSYESFNKEYGWVSGEKFWDGLTAQELLRALAIPGQYTWICSEELSNEIRQILESGISETGRYTYELRRNQCVFTPVSDPSAYSAILFYETAESWFGFKFELDWKPAELAEGIQRFEEKFRIGIRGFSTTAGNNLLKQIRNRIDRNQKINIFVQPSHLKPFEDDHTSNLAWSRKLTPADSGKKYLHVFDKQAHFLTAAEEVHVGIGDADHVHNPEFDKAKPGLWCCSFDGEWSKSYLDPRNIKKDHSWYYTPTVSLMISLGFTPTISEAHIFENKAKVFDKWAKELKEIAKPKANTREDKLFRTMAKSVAVRSIGNLANTDNRSKEDLSWAYRPDWRGMIISTAVAKLYYGIAKIEKLSEQQPVAITVDSLYYLSDEPDARKALPCLFTDLNLVNGYRYEVTYDISAPINRDKFGYSGFAGNIKNAPKVEGK